MRVRRDVSSIPFLSAGATWKRIIELATGPGSKDIQQLRDAGGVMGSIISDELPAQRAILVEGVGPQLRMYCRYGKKAVEAGDAVDAQVVPERACRITGSPLAPCGVFGLPRERFVACRDADIQMRIEPIVVTRQNGKGIFRVAKECLRHRDRDACPGGDG